MTIDDVRRMAQAVPEVAEEPYFQMASFRIKRKIFATVPPDNEHLHLFVDELEREKMLTLHSEAYESCGGARK